VPNVAQAQSPLHGVAPQTGEAAHSASQAAHSAPEQRGSTSPPHSAS